MARLVRTFREITDAVKMVAIITARRETSKRHRCPVDSGKIVIMRAGDTGNPLIAKETRMRGRKTRATGARKKKKKKKRNKEEKTRVHTRAD